MYVSFAQSTCSNFSIAESYNHNPYIRIRLLLKDGSNAILLYHEEKIKISISLGER